MVIYLDHVEQTEITSYSNFRANKANTTVCFRLVFLLAVHKENANQSVNSRMKSENFVKQLKYEQHSYKIWIYFNVPKINNVAEIIVIIWLFKGCFMFNQNTIEFLPQQ